MPVFEVTEIEHWKEGSETWRSLRVRFPPSFASHSIDQEVPPGGADPNERATNEARARRLTERHKESPLTVQEIAALRKREPRTSKAKDAAADPPPRKRRPLAFIERFEAEVRKDAGAMSQLEELARRLGYRLVPVTAQGQA